VLLLFVVISGRLVQLQLTDASAYAADGLHDRLQRVPLAAPRGAIYDRDGEVLAHSVDARYVYADPGLVQNPEQEADALSPLLGVPRSELVPKLRRHKFPNGTQVRFEWLARGVDIPVADKVRALNLPGIGIRQDEKREVPGHDLAANVIGFTGQDLKGLVGLESGYDDVLRGVEGERTFEIGDGNLAAEIPGGYHQEKPARPGTSLQLTIDRDLQYQVQHILYDRMRQVNATFGSAVVLDVRTGEVMAQASYPGYDAAEPFKVQTPAGPVQGPVQGPQWTDANTDVVVDPGSVAKVVTLGGALQEGVVNPDTAVTVGPTVRKGDQTYRDTHPFPSGTRITLPALLAFSSNVGTIAVADQLGPQRLYDYQQKFGLGRPTGEGLPGEAGGLVQPPRNWSGSSYGSIPIGQGVSVTPLQMATVYAAIANDGMWVQPHLVRATVGRDGKVTPSATPAGHRVLSPATAAALRTMLEAVVTVDGATGRGAALPGYRVAGKTGTGSKVVDGHYVAGDVASFIGMAPADAPRYVIAVFAHTPGGEGGKVAAPAFRDMMAFTLSRFHVPPTGTPAPTFVITK
jgi:cell division protein FtsI (penicillin-binding protein 3)